jgi:hypothetical protein
MVYYNAIMLGIVSAFRHLGKEVWDVQHGLIGPTHGAYNNSKAYSLDSNFRPTGFLVWNTNFGSYIEETLGVHWKSTDYLHLKGFQQSSNSYRDRKTILYSLQWGTPIPDDVKYVVRHLEGVDWIFRKHPHEAADCDDLEWLSDFPNANLVDASEPLAAALSRSMLHVTFNSSVVFEAAVLNIPSIILANSINSPNADSYAIFSDPIGEGIACIVDEGALMSAIMYYLSIGISSSLVEC